MDWAVWDWTHDDQGAQEGSFIGRESQSGLFLYPDVIEETALNEKSCVQVLRLLITKANNEILELEEELITLQGQLAWADESWSEICSAALREKVVGLDISLQNLKNINVHDLGDCSQFYGEPAEKVHKILKPLLENYVNRTDEQSTNVKESSSVDLHHVKSLMVEKKGLSGSALETICEEDVTGTNTNAALHYGTDLMVEKRRLSSSASEIIRNEEVIEINTKPAQRDVAFNGSLESGQRKTSYPGSHPNSIINASILHTSTTAPRITNGETILRIVDPASNRRLDASKNAFASSDNCLIHDSSPKTPLNSEPSEPPVNSVILEGEISLKYKKNDIEETDKPESASSTDASETAIDLEGKDKSIRLISEVIGPVEVTEHNSEHQSAILDSSFQHEERKSDIPETEFRTAALQEATEESDVSPILIKNQGSSPTNSIDPPLSSLKIKKKRTQTRIWKRKGPEPGLNDIEQNAADSLLKLLNHREEPIVKHQLGAEPRQETKLAADGKPISNLPPKLKKMRAKKEHQQKQKAGEGIALKVNTDSASQFQKRRKCQTAKARGETKKLKSLQISQAKLPADHTESTSMEELCVTKFFLTNDPHNETPKMLPAPTICTAPNGLDFECLTLIDLRAIAKQHNIKGYSKLKKAKLVEELRLKLMVHGGCT